jgi:hypothetical protein
VKAKPMPPAGLSRLSRRLWNGIQAGYMIKDPAGLAVLEQTLRALDRAEAARLVVNRQGCTLVDRYHQARIHPAAAVERDARAQFFAGLKLLRVDVPINAEGEED